MGKVLLTGEQEQHRMNERETEFRRLTKMASHNEPVFTSWSITAAQADQLYQSVLQDKGKKIKYSRLGRSAFFAGASYQEVDNCYTWAREKLLACHNPDIRLPKKWTDRLFVWPGSHIETTLGA